MDALKFLEEFDRMCNLYIKNYCKGCPRAESPYCGVDGMNKEERAKLISEVEQWSKEHPPRTRLQDFKEKYPNMKCRDSGIPWACCSYLGYCESCDEAKSDCIVCWNMPVEE